MGLGKTIQAIALAWTLLRQGPTGLPVCQKAVILCPSSLVGNWVKEINKWLNGVLKAMPIGDSKKAVGKMGKVGKKKLQIIMNFFFHRLKVEFMMFLLFPMIN